MILTVYNKDGKITETLEVGDEAKITNTLNKGGVITLDYFSNRPLNVQIGSYIYYQTYKYTINEIPKFTKNGSNSFKYSFFW